MANPNKADSWAPLYPSEKKDPARKSYGPGFRTVIKDGVTQVVRSPVVEGVAPPSKPSGGGGGGGGGDRSPPPNPFHGAASVKLPSKKEIQKGYLDAMERGKKLLEALGHESFRDFAAEAMASKFTLPENFQQMLSGEMSQPVTNANSLPSYDPSLIGTQARTALQKGLTTIPPSMNVPGAAVGAAPRVGTPSASTSPIQLAPTPAHTVPTPKLTR